MIPAKSVENLNDKALRLTAIIRAHSTPESLQSLSNALQDDYSYPTTLGIVAEIVTSADGSGWGCNGQVVRVAAEAERGHSTFGREKLRSTVIKMLLTAPIPDPMPIAPGHAWWIRLSDDRRAHLISRCVMLHGMIQDAELDRAIVLLPEGEGRVCMSGNPEALRSAGWLVLCEYCYGEPLSENDDGIGLSNEDAALLAICAALGVS